MHLWNYGSAAGQVFWGLLADSPVKCLLERRVGGMIHRKNLTTSMTGITLHQCNGRLAQLVRAFGLHPKCRWFESGSAHHLFSLDSDIL